MLFGGVPPGIPQPQNPPPDPPVEEPPDPVLEWRKLYLQRAGYDEEAAALLAEDRAVDHHRAAGLLEKGCEVTTALLILL
jgi:hypothetical protein